MRLQHCREGHHGVGRQGEMSEDITGGEVMGGEVVGETSHGEKENRYGSKGEAVAHCKEEQDVW